MTFILPGGLGQQKASVAFSALDPANTYTAAGLVLSNNNRTVTASSSSGGGGCSRGIKSRNSGKYYFEFTINTDGVTSGGPGIGNTGGFANSSAAISNAGVGFDTSSWGVGSITNSNIYTSYNATYTNYLGVNAAPGLVLMCAVDFSGTKIWFGAGGNWCNNGNVSTLWNSAAPDFTTTVGTTLWPMLAVVNNPQVGQSTLNTGYTAFTYTPPAGYVAWG